MSQRDPQGPGAAPGQFAGPEEEQITTPMLRWIRIVDPGQMMPIGENEEVLDTVYNGQYNAWEVLVRTPPEEAPE